jgi:hypothetical protein
MKRVIQYNRVSFGTRQLHPVPGYIEEYATFGTITYLGNNPMTRFHKLEQSGHV